MRHIAIRFHPFRRYFTCPSVLATSARNVHRGNHSHSARSAVRRARSYLLVHLFHSNQPGASLQVRSDVGWRSRWWWGRWWHAHVSLQVVSLPRPIPPGQYNAMHYNHNHSLLVLSYSSVFYYVLHITGHRVTR